MSVIQCDINAAVICKSVEAEPIIRLDWSANLQPADTIVAVTATEATTTLTLSNAQPNPTEAVILGQVVPPGKGAEVFVQNLSKVPGQYVIVFAMTYQSGASDHYGVRLEMK